MLIFAVLASTCAAIAPAAAGGSVWYFDRPFYEPGDRVVAGTAVTWSHLASLGTPDDGPYGVWIERAGPELPSSLAARVERARYVTDVRIEQGPGEINGVRYGPNIARAEFTLPDVPPGFYALLHCNYPCTTQLGDITWGSFWVGPPDPFALPTTGQAAAVAPPPAPSTTAAATTTTVPQPAAVEQAALIPRNSAHESGSSLVPWVVGGAVIALGAGLIGLTITQGRRRRAQG